MEKLAIQVNTQEEYNQLMEIYENKGWKRKSGNSPIDRKPAFFKLGYAIDFHDRFTYDPAPFYQELSLYKILSFQELLQMENQPKRGDWVWVSENKVGKWYKRIYLATIEGLRYPYICVNDTSEEAFKYGQKFLSTEWEAMKSITETELTLQEIADKFGIPINQLRIKE